MKNYDGLCHLFFFRPFLRSGGSVVERLSRERGVMGLMADCLTKTIIKMVPDAPLLNAQLLKSYSKNEIDSIGNERLIVNNVSCDNFAIDPK